MGDIGMAKAQPEHGQDPIAIIGMACRLPGNSNSPQALWDLLERGGCAIGGVPESRFNLNGHFDGSRKPNTLRSAGAMFLEDIDLTKFDAQFFSTARQEAIAMDPQQRQLLEVVYECLENSGVTRKALNGAPVGCFVASSTSDYKDIHARDPEDRPANATVGLVPAILSNRVSHFFNLKGPSMTIDTACSASLASLDVAMKYMQVGDMTAAIVAGVHLWLSPEANMDSGAMKEAFSPSGKCHTFDAKADGYIKAEGVNALIIKRLEDAIKDGDPIRAVIRGSATNSNGRTAGIANPSAEAQAAAINAAYTSAGISDLAATTYLECHGTGTLAGDPVEVQAASSVLRNKNGAEPLIIGSIKSNIGHSECSAGISGVIKTVLALEKGIIPGNPTFITPNPRIDFTGLRVQATRTCLPWPKVPLRRASVNSFGFGGSNAHVVLEEAKPWGKPSHVSSLHTINELDDFFAEREAVTDTLSVLVFSAIDELALAKYIDALRKHLVYPATGIELQDLTYTLSERRTHHLQRGFVVTNKAIFDSKALVTGKKTTEPPRIGFVFTGQGAQWPGMGRFLVKTFPLAGKLLNYLDSVLKECLLPPSWSLIEGLTKTQSAETLRQPALSQPLVTALQIILVEILRSWGIRPKAVVGHSSGEIAAAYCAGYVSMEDAIKAAFYRGQASIEAQKCSKENQGMLAVGLGAQELTNYLTELDSPVEVACYNSPTSVTLSGCVGMLLIVEARLKAGGHFARMLHVDLAYHSRYVGDISHTYKNLLDQDYQSKPFSKLPISMYSSALGHKLDRATDSSYWQLNMASPVYFEQAMREMVSVPDSANFLIEIGPSSALADPIAQIKASLPQQGSEIQYHTTLRRNQEDLKYLFELAGHLFVAGAKIDMVVVNRLENCSPRIIVDLPNYAWNHSERYWYESQASKDWRFKLFPPHDLIGGKVLGTSWHAPTWKKDLKLEDIPWLGDHKLGSDIVVPGAAMVVMAVEAMAQLTHALHDLEEKPMPKVPCYRVRNATFSRALVLQEREKQTVMMTLGARAGSKDSWYEFKIHSVVNGNLLEHSRGFVRVEEDPQKVACEGDLRPLVNSLPGALWYQAMEDVGYALGPAFQKLLEVESVSGIRTGRSIVNLRAPACAFAQSNYQMHPTSVDGIFQACGPAFWNGNRTNMDAVIIPASIDDLVICPQPSSTTTGIAVISSAFTGTGDPNETRNYTVDAKVYDITSGRSLLQLSRLRTSVLNARAVSYIDPTYCSLNWKPDITFLAPEALAGLLRLCPKDGGSEWATINEVIDLVAFKTPNLNVYEGVLVPEYATSVWLGDVPAASSIRMAYESFHFAHIDPEALHNAQKRYPASKNVNYRVEDLSSTYSPKTLTEIKFNLVIIRTRSCSKDPLLNILRNAYTMLRDGGRLLLIESEGSRSNSMTALHNDSGYDRMSVLNASSLELLSPAGFGCQCRIPQTPLSIGGSGLLSTKTTERSTPPAPPNVHMVHFSPIPDSGAQVIDGLEARGWRVSRDSYPFQKLEFDGTILILEDFTSPFLSTVKEEHWALLQSLIKSGNRILWLTQGSQLEVEMPENAQIHGLMRTLRDEDPSINFTTLDVESAAGEHTIPTTHAVLEFLRTSKFESTGDYEFVERRGTIHISRVLPDDLVNGFTKKEREGAEPTLRSFYDSESQTRLFCERIGNLDSLNFNEVSQEECQLDDGEVEIEIAAAGLNFKDIAISSGLIPGNERLLGFEGAGIVRRSNSDVHLAGQRVLFTKAGAFANRIISETELVHPIPDSMSFEEAATLGAVYSVAMYSLFDLASIKREQRVLIHSAAGGLGVACIQLCQYIGAEIYATVGNDEKRRFLVDSFGIPSSRIFTSRSTEFATELLQATNGEGVDVIINSLTGDLLEESWGCVRDGGTMVELGKKDIIERNYLPMEPFSRNVSYRSFDISHKSVSNATRARLLKQVFALLDKGHIKPIFPITVFSFNDIASAFRYMRDGKHMGKIVISNGRQVDFRVPVRNMLPSVKLRSDVSYLIIGGLKGLCGSVALLFARLGAKHLTVMGRSGFEDEASQRVVCNIQAEGCKIHCIKGDVTVKEDVKNAFKSACVPVGGIVQGAMAVRGKLYQAMTAEDYQFAAACKVQGTWNLHNVSLEDNLSLNFFSILSSTSGVAGQSGQANYVAANAFLDAFAIYRRKMGLRANSNALGPMWDVGYMSRNKQDLPRTNTSTFHTISETLFHEIIQLSILQQTDVINEESASHLITGMAIPLQESSTLRCDARFSGLFGPTTSSHIGAKGVSDAVQAIQGSPAQNLDKLVEIMSRQLASILRLNEPIEPAAPLSNYGMESLAATELRNWIRMELHADVTMLEIVNVASLTALCEKILAKMQPST